MCDVVSAGLLIASAASTAAGYASQAKAASDQSKYENNVYSATAKAANANYQQTVSQTNLQTYQTNTAEGAQAVQNEAALRASKGTAVVQEGEAGAAGNTVNELLGNFDRLSAQNKFTLDTNQQWRQQQTSQNLLSAQAQANNQTTSAMPHPVQMPSVLSAALQIGSSAFAAYDQDQQYNMSGPYNKNTTGGFGIYKNWFSK